MKFDKKSRRLIAKGMKSITCRRTKHGNDPDVLFCFGYPFTLREISKKFYVEEGCKTPKELRKWIKKIYDDYEGPFFVHVIHPKCIERIKKENKVSSIQGTNKKSEWDKSFEEDNIAKKLGWKCPMECFDSCGSHCKYWRLSGPRNRCIHKEEFIKWSEIEREICHGTVSSCDDIG
ncbi:MAG: hypothetical protein JXB42_00165 [Deltaproteobacteria bacterium]|nr:hypothetical protein [Deltaproteobacteria bacterium]